jgi:hypothetical protein
MRLSVKDDHAREILAGVKLLPDFALALEDVEELVDPLEALAVLDGARVSRGSAVDQEGASGNGHDRRFDHVERVLCHRQTYGLVDGNFARRAERPEEEDDRDDEEVDHARQRETRDDASVVSAGHALLHELQRDMVHQPATRLVNRHGILS